MSEATSLLARLVGRHHREMMLTRDTCAACHNFTPSYGAVKAAIEAEAAESEGRDWRDEVQHAQDAINAALDKASYGDFVEGDLLEAHATLDTLLTSEAKS